MKAIEADVEIYVHKSETKMSRKQPTQNHWILWADTQKFCAPVQIT